MPAPEHILTKIKLLLKLASSPNPNEADNARIMAEKLISKYNITEEELQAIEDPAPLYGEDEKLFSTSSIIGWKSQLALAIAKHFDCYIVQEELVPTDGSREYNYYVYGDKEDVNSVKFVFQVFIKKIKNLISIKCAGRGPIYIESYSEGVAQSIKQNLELYGIDLPESKIPIRIPNQDKAISNGSSNLTKSKEEKPKPMEASIDVSSQSFIKDVAAYFKGIADGNIISLQDALDSGAENELKITPGTDPIA